MHIMKNKISLSIAVLLGMLTPVLSSCNDQEEEFNEWTATYVSLQRQDYLSGDVKKFNLNHDASGVNGDEITLTFNVKTQQPAPADITVALDVESEEGLDANLITLSNPSVILKKGETVSEDITATINRETFADTRDKFQYAFQVSINHIVTSDKNIVVSDYLRTLRASINKAAYCNLKAATPENSTLLTNKTDWEFTFQDGVENTGSNSVAGTGGNDVATDGVPFWVTVDLKKTQEIRGIQTTHWGADYAPTEVEIFHSTDGTNWSSLGVIATSGQAQYITFITPVETRYLKYQMLKVPIRVDLMTLYVYIPAKMNVPSAQPEDWTEIDRTGWGIECNTPPYDNNYYSLEGMLDGNPNTGYFTAANNASPIIIDMIDTHAIKGVSIAADGHYYAATYSLQNVQILTSTDKQTWEDFLSISLKQAANGTTPQYIELDKTVDARYIKIVPLGAYGGFFGISEFRAYK